MNKGLTNYFRLRRVVLDRQVVLALAFMFLFLSHLVVYTWGRIDGWDKAEAYTEKNIEQSLYEAIEDGHNFQLHNMNIKFYPREDKGVNVAMFRIVETQAERVTK